MANHTPPPLSQIKDVAKEAPIMSLYGDPPPKPIPPEIVVFREGTVPKRNDPTLDGIEPTNWLQQYDSMLNSEIVTAVLCGLLPFVVAKLISMYL